MGFLTPDSVVLVAASSAGLGAATARAFAAKGAKVVVNYLNSREKAERLVQELSTLDPRPSQAPGTDGSAESARPRFIAIQADLSKRSEIIRLVAETQAQMGRLDAVVSNQGWTRLRNFSDLNENVDEDDWDKCFNVNVKSHLFLFHAAREQLEKSKGAFISVASLAGVKPGGSSMVCCAYSPSELHIISSYVNYQAYSVSKAAQIHLMKALALTCGPIRVNSVSPGLMLTVCSPAFY